MEQLLWSFEDIKRFTNHPDAPVRLWAVERLIKLFPDQAGDVLVTLLDDKGRFIAGQSLNFLTKTGEAEKYGPTLLEHLQRASGEHFGRLAATLSGLDYRPALPVILKRIEQGDKRAGLGEYWGVIGALGGFGGDEVRQTLWTMLEKAGSSTDAAFPPMEALLMAAQPQDVPRLVQHYRALPFDEGSRRTPLFAFASSVDAVRLVDELSYASEDGLEAMLESAGWWLGVPLPVSETCRADLKEAFDNDYSGAVEILLREARRLVEERGDDLTGWQTAWEAGESPTGYRRRALYTLFILAGLAAQPPADSTQRRKESLLSLSLLLQLSVDSDDQTLLETAADKTEALLAILTQPREHVLPDIVERVASLGPEIVPRLIDLLNPKESGWADIRIARVIERMARLYPGSCNAVAPQLIACIHEEQGDYMNEAASGALEAIGPAAVQPINEHLRHTQDMSCEIYLTGVLGEIPVESAAQALLDKIKTGESVGEMEFGSLAHIGSASAIEPLYKMWEPGDRLLAEFLLILCELNNVQKPEIPEWRRLVEAQYERMDKAMSGDFDLLEGLKNLPNPLPPIPTWQLEGGETKASSDRKGIGPKDAGRKGAVSKKEKRKRIAQRKAARGTRKKRKRKKRRRK